MSERVVAPALRAVVAWPPPYAKTGMNAALVSIQAKRELEALESVARAVNGFLRARRACDRLASQSTADDFDAAEIRLRRAANRLARAPLPRPPRKAARRDGP